MQYDEQSLYTRMTARYQELAGFVPDEASDIALRFHALSGELAQVCAVRPRLRRRPANGWSFMPGCADLNGLRPRMRQVRLYLSGIKPAGRKWCLLGHCALPRTKPLI